MVRINSINGVNNYPINNKPLFKGSEVQTNPQIGQLPDIQPDYSVKTPISYIKTGEINFPYDTKAYCYKLSNGQKVIIVPQEGETVLRTYVNTGSMNEPDKLRGISHYIEHNLFNGSQGIENGDFFKQIDKMGASTNASTGFAETNYYISSNLLNESDLETKIKLHSSMLETPIFAVEKLEKEKGIVNSEINMITSDPENLAVNKMIKNLYGIKSTSTDMIGGTTDNITNLTREDVVNYFNNNYYPANMVTVITGDVKPDETMKLISKYFTSKKQSSGQRHIEKFNPIQKTVREDLISDKANASSIVVGFNGPTPDNTKDRIYTKALLYLLSASPTSRIDKKIKQYNAGSRADDEKISTNQRDGRLIMITSACSDENCEKVLKNIFNEIGNIANNPPSDDEMHIVKKKMLNNFSLLFENSFGTNNAIGTAILENNEDYLNNFEQIVKSMTAQDLVNTAKKYLDINKAAVTVVHPSSATAESIQQNYKKVSFTGAKKEAINMANVKEYNMPNNYRIATINSKTDNVKINFRISTDQTYNSRPSAELVLNKILDEGSISRNQQDFQTDLAKNGITSSICAGYDSISATITCNCDDLVKALKSLREVAENPRFTDSEFEHAKADIKDAILTSDKSAFDKLENEIYKGLPAGCSKEEILKDLETLKLDDVKKLYDYTMKNGKSGIAISAPFDKKPELNQQIFNTIGSFKSVLPYNPKVLQEVYKPVEQTKVLTDTDFKNQAEIVEAYKFQVNGNIKDRIALELLNTILGGNPSSRLFGDLREQQKLAYHVSSNLETYNNIGLLTLKIGTTTDNKETGEQSFENVQKAIEGFNKHIEKLKKENVSQEELNNAKLSLKNTLLNSNNTSYGRTVSLIQGLESPYGITRENQLYDEIDKITADDIYNTANYIFSGKPTYSILATEDTLNANKEFLASLPK